MHRQYTLGHEPHVLFHIDFILCPSRVKHIPDHEQTCIMRQRIIDFHYFIQQTSSDGNTVISQTYDGILYFIILKYNNLLNEGKRAKNNHRMCSVLPWVLKISWIRCVILVINVSYFKKLQANYWYSCKRLLFIHVSRNQMFLHFISVSRDFVVKCVKCVKDSVCIHPVITK